VEDGGGGGGKVTRGGLGGGEDEEEDNCECERSCPTSFMGVVLRGPEEGAYLNSPSPNFFFASLTGGV